MKGIIAVNNLGYIGLNDSLPWRCREDLKHFKMMTSGSSVLVGYNTFNTLPPLEGREILLDIRDHMIPSADWCIGGKKTYEKYAHLFTELHISYINDNTIGDTMFPDLKNLNPDCRVFKYNFEPNKAAVKAVEIIKEEPLTFGQNPYIEQNQGNKQQVHG